MKVHIFLLSLVIPVIIAFIGTWQHGNPVQKYTGADTLLKSGQLTFSTKSLGGHSQNCILIDMKNNTEDPLCFYLEPGRRMVSDDSTLQDILIVKRKNIRLPPGGFASVTGYGYCCESSMHSPSANAGYGRSFMEGPGMVRLANVISENDFPSSAEQAAVWVLSNGHSIASVCDADMKKVELLRKTLAEIQHIELPWYSITYEKDSAMLFSGRHLNVSGEVPYYIKNNCTVSISVRNQNNSFVKRINKGTPHNPGDYTFYLDLDVKGWPKGKYAVCVMEDQSNLITKRTFEL
jgi:hypothetical protein